MKSSEAEWWKWWTRTDTLGAPFWSPVNSQYTVPCCWVNWWQLTALPFARNLLQPNEDTLPRRSRCPLLSINSWSQIVAYDWLVWDTKLCVSQSGHNAIVQSFTKTCPSDQTETSLHLRLPPCFFPHCSMLLLSPFSWERFSVNYINKNPHISFWF